MSELPFLATSLFHELTGSLIAGVVANRPTNLLIRGEAGLGKTTNLERSIQHLADRFGLVLRARSHPLKLAYYPLADAIWSIADSAKQKHTARLLLLDAASDLIKLVPMLGPFAPDLTELLGTPSPTMPTAAIEPLDVAFHMRRLLRHVSKSKPILLVFDDVHDFDTSTLSALSCLFRDLPTGCSVLLALDPTAVSPDDMLRHDFEDQIVEQFSFRRLDLTTLSMKDTGDLATIILGDRATDEIKSLVHRFTSGNPFFVVEVCASLKNQSVGSERLAEDARLPLTERLARFVDRRLRQVATELRPTLDMASVFGPAFPSMPMAACMGRDHMDVLRHLRALETIYRIVRSSESDHYHFTVPVIRERVYELLGRDVAREQHLLIARTLSLLSPNSMWDFEIGRHLLLGGHTEEGLDAIRRSAVSAANANRFGDAADRFHRLAAAYTTTRVEDVAGRQQALLQTVRCLRQQRDIPAAVAYCKRLASESDISPLIAPSFALEEASLAYYVDDFEGSVAKCNGILSQFADSLGLATRVHVRLTLSAALYHLGRWSEARHHYRRCFAERGITEDSLLLAQALKRVNMFYIPELALPKLTAVVVEDRLNAAPDLRFELLTNIGMNYLRFSEFDTASRYFDDALRGFQALGSRKQTYPMNDLALAEMLAGRYSSARHMFARLIADFTEEFERDCARSNEAVCALMEGDAEWAADVLQQMWNRVSDDGSPVLMELVGNNLGLAMAGTGRAKEAVKLIIETSSCREQVATSFERGRRHRLVERIGGGSAQDFLAATAADYERLAISGRRDAGIYRDTDYEIGDLWFWE